MNETIRKFYICLVMACLTASSVLASNDEKKASRKIHNYQKECDEGSGRACSGLGAFYEAGEGVSRNIEMAELLYKKACDKGRGPMLDLRKQTAIAG